MKLKMTPLHWNFVILLLTFFAYAVQGLKCRTTQEVQQNGDFEYVVRMCLRRLKNESDFSENLFRLQNDYNYSSNKRYRDDSYNNNNKNNHNNDNNNESNENRNYFGRNKGFQDGFDKFWSSNDNERNRYSDEDRNRQDRDYMDGESDFYNGNRGRKKYKFRAPMPHSFQQQMQHDRDLMFNHGNRESATNFYSNRKKNNNNKFMFNNKGNNDSPLAEIDPCVIHCIFHEMQMTACLFSLPQGRTEPRTGIRRYKPVIQVTEEIDINDITFTTSSPFYDRSSSHKVFNYHNGIKSDVKSTSFESPPPSIHSHISYKDSYGTSLPLERTYSTVHPIVVPTVKYKPLTVYKTSNGHDEFKLHHKIKEQEKGNVQFEPPTTFRVTSTSDNSKQYSAKIVPFPSEYLSAKGPTKPTTFHGQDGKTFIPSPTFSPMVLAQINKESNEKFVPEIKKLNLEKKEVEWKKATKKPTYIKKSKKVLSDSNLQTTKPPSEDYFEEISEQDNEYKDSPQSESFLSEISTLHQGGGSGNNLDGAPDSLDLKTGERVEFQMYGMDGPQSYKFGYDTGKGQNRHFRFEERDNTGKVKGHYGYLDEDGKMRIMKYEADPITGFHAGPIEISPEDN